MFEPELKACLDDMDSWPSKESTTRLKALLHKLIAHIHYSNFTTNASSQNHLEKVITLCDHEPFEDADWYRLFCHDHIQNRATNDVRTAHAEQFIAARSCG